MEEVVDICTFVQAGCTFHQGIADQGWATYFCIAQRELFLLMQELGVHHSATELIIANGHILQTTGRLKFVCLGCLPNSYEYRIGLFKKEPCLQTNCEWWRPKSLKLFVTNNLVSSMSLCLSLVEMGATPFQSKQSSPECSLVTTQEECSTFSVSICSDLKICLPYLCWHLSCIHELWTLTQSRFTPPDTYWKQN